MTVRFKGLQTQRESFPHLFIFKFINMKVSVWYISSLHYTQSCLWKTRMTCAKGCKLFLNLSLTHLDPVTGWLFSPHSLQHCRRNCATWRCSWIMRSRPKANWSTNTGTGAAETSLGCSRLLWLKSWIRILFFNTKSSDRRIIRLMMTDLKAVFLPANCTHILAAVQKNCLHFAQ